MKPSSDLRPMVSRRQNWSMKGKNLRRQFSTSMISDISKEQSDDLSSPTTLTYTDAMGSRAKVYAHLITVKLGRLAPPSGKRFHKLMDLT